MALPVQFRVPMPGRAPLPGYPPTPWHQSIPQIPMPHLPEPWPTIGKVMQLLPRWGLQLDQGDNGYCPGCQDAENGSNESGVRPRAPKSPLPGPAPIPPSFGSRFSKTPKSSGSGGGGRGRGRDEDDSQCYERESSERANCYKRIEEYPHWDFLAGCLERAGNRRDLCVKSGGRLDHEGPAEWDPDKDEEIYYNFRR
jgi:hypothetical protein